MPRRSTVYAVLGVLAVLIGTVTVAFTTPALSATVPTRIMPLGDSITAGPGCWRALLWDRLQRAGYTNIDFVGTQSSGGCTVPFDTDHEGHPGMSATDIASQNLLPGWLSATNPDIVLMHLGTNDMWGSFIPTSSIIAAYGTLVDQMRANNPDMTIIVAQIIPMNPSSCPGCAQEVVALDAAIPGWAASKSTAQSPVVVVDQWTGFDTATDTIDGVHPNASGDQKMSNRFYPALAQLLGTAPTVPPSTATPTRTPAPTRPTTPSASAPPTPTRSPASPSPTVSPSQAPASGCTVAYSVTNQWQNGFQGAVRITNTAGTAVNGWTLRWSFGGGQMITQLWNGAVAQAGADVTVTNASYNGTLAAGGGTADIGFLASWNNTTNANPTSFTLNGVSCSVA